MEGALAGLLRRHAQAGVLTTYCTGPRAAHLSGLGKEEAVDVVLADLQP